jgi:hypothetical protein
MVVLGPVGRVDPDTGRSVVEVPEALTDADLDWINRHLVLAGELAAVRTWPTVDIRPDPRIAQRVER